MRRANWQVRTGPQTHSVDRQVPVITASTIILRGPAMCRAFAQSLASEDAAVLQLSGFGAQLLALQISPEGLGLSHGIKHAQTSPASCY